MQRACRAAIYINWLVVQQYKWREGKKTITAGCKVGKEFDYVQKAEWTLFSKIFIAQRAANMSAIKVEGKKGKKKRATAEVGLLKIYM